MNRFEEKKEDLVLNVVLSIEDWEIRRDYQGAFFSADSAIGRIELRKVNNRRRQGEEEDTNDGGRYSIRVFNREKITDVKERAVIGIKNAYKKRNSRDSSLISRASDSCYVGRSVIKPRNQGLTRKWGSRNCYGFVFPESTMPKEYLQLNNLYTKLHKSTNS